MITSPVRTSKCDATSVVPSYSRQPVIGTKIMARTNCVCQISSTLSKRFIPYCSEFWAVNVTQ